MLTVVKTLVRRSVLLVSVFRMHADARTLMAAAYAPYNAKAEHSETPAYKAEVSKMLDSQA